VLVFVALGMTMLLTMAAIVLDLGRTYVTARLVQNASDAAAMAGASTLDKMRLAGYDAITIGASVEATVRQIASRNGGDPDLTTCMFISWDGTVLAPCTEPSAAAVASGVDVNVGAVNQTGFAKILGVDSLRVDRQAAATIQPLVGHDAPLLVCGFDQPNAPDLLIPTTPTMEGGSSYGVNPAAVSPDDGYTGPVYRAHAPHVADCGLHGESFKGVAGEGPFMLPDWLPIATGVRAGPTRVQIAGEPGCGTDYVLDCVLILPICSGSNGRPGSNGQMFCNVWGAFRLTAKSANTQDFRLLGAAQAIIGIGGNGWPGPNDVRLIRLIR
jgi:hypothetical protein